jgi:general secretion pathway protein B
MSLILDALKKSEAERQRQSGPTLLEVRVTQPRRRYPTWVIAVGVLLAVNILLLLAFVLRRPATQAAPPAAASAAPAANAASTASVPAAPSAQIAGPLPASVAPIASAAPSTAATAPPGTPPASASGDGGVLVTPPRMSAEPDLAADALSGNPADDEPAVPAGAVGRFSSLPSFNDVGGDMPELRLDLHVYAAHAPDRYALINMHRVHEGDTLAEGPRVLAITREGVALDYRGQQFMLRPQ